MKSNLKKEKKMKLNKLWTGTKLLADGEKIWRPRGLKTQENTLRKEIGINQEKSDIIVSKCLTSINHHWLYILIS